MSRVVPIQSDVNTNAAFFAPASGTGGGTSTISLGVNGAIIYQSSVTFVDRIGVQPSSFTFLTDPSSALLGAPTNFFNMQAPAASSTSAVSYYIGNAEAGLETQSAGSGSALPYSIRASVLNTTNMAISQNLNVSSINGAIPAGGSITPDPAFSTVQVQFNMNVSSINGALPAGGSVNPDPSFSTVQVQYNMNVSSINGQTPGGGGAADPNPSFSTIAVAGAGTLGVVISPVASISTLVASTINGGVPPKTTRAGFVTLSPAGSLAVSFTTNFPPGSGVIVTATYDSASPGALVPLVVSDVTASGFNIAGTASQGVGYIATIAT